MHQVSHGVELGVRVLSRLGSSRPHQRLLQGLAAGYKDPYGLDVPVNTFAGYYYSDWWKSAALEKTPSTPSRMRFSGYGSINDGTATPRDFHGRVVVVDSTGAGDARTVQAGVDMAKPGETVFVKAGTYRETVKLKEGIRLWGENPYKTIIDSENKGSTIVAANRCDISGFTLTGTGFDYSADRFRAAVHAVDCDSTLVIRGNIFFSNSVFGVLVESSRATGITHPPPTGMSRPKTPSRTSNTRDTPIP